MRRLTWLGFLFALVVATGCGSSNSDGTDGNSTNDCSGDVPTYDKVAIFDKCKMCHSSQLQGSAARRGSPPTINFDTEAGADTAAREAESEVKTADMPPTGSGVIVTNAEKQALYTWVDCMAK
jgi:uncharacterized membrane protein